MATATDPLVPSVPSNFPDIGKHAGEGNLQSATATLPAPQMITEVGDDGNDPVTDPIYAAIQEPEAKIGPSQRAQHFDDNIRRSHRTANELERALRAAGGFTSAAARMLKMTTRGVNKRIHSNPDLQAVQAEIRSGYIDVAEYELLRAVKKGDLEAIKYYLRYQGKDRGYAVETGTDGTPAAPELEVAPVLIIQFTDEKAPESLQQSESLTIDGGKLEAAG